MKGLSEFLRQHVVAALRDLGVPINLQDLQLVLVLLPIAFVVAAFVRASSNKRRRMRDAGM